MTQRRILQKTSLSLSYLDDVEEVVVTQCVDDLGDSRLGYLDAQSLHAAARVNQDHDVLGRRRRLDVPVHDVINSEPD